MTEPLENTPENQPDGQAAWDAMMAKLNQDEQECLQIMVEENKKQALGAGFRAGQEFERNARKTRNKIKRFRREDN